MKFFNTAGPVVEGDHYLLDPLSRIDFPDVMDLVRQKKYFVLHAPRQTGKTSMLLAMTKKINREGQYRCLYVNVETAQASREDVSSAVRSIGSMMGKYSINYMGDHYIEDHREALFRQESPQTFLFSLLSNWTLASDKPTIVLVDEIDSLMGDSLVSVLRQLRSGYSERPYSFPQSIILCGVRDVRDYRIHASSEKDPVTGGSAFNVKAKSLRMGNFNQDEVYELLQQHTTETGQVFTPEALEAIWDNTHGQPWLVNALAHELTYEIKVNRDRSVVLTEEMVYQARENLIYRRETHLDQLADKLKEPRVHRIVAPMLAGTELSSDVGEDDIEYVYDLGLIEKRPQLKIANPIYREVIPRTLIWASQLTIAHQTHWYIDPKTGFLDMAKLLAAFQQFFREHSESWVDLIHYKEAGRQLLLQAFLQRVINGGGKIEREYGLGRGRTDILVVLEHQKGVQRIVLELKIQKGKRQTTVENALPQITKYMDQSGATEGHLLIFDKSDTRWEDKIFHDEITHEGITVQIWGM